MRPYQKIKEKADQLWFDDQPTGSDILEATPTPDHYIQAIIYYIDEQDEK